MSNGSTGVFMRRASFIAFTVGGMLILGPASDVWAQSGAGGTPRAGWYVGGGIGANWASDTDQEGWNQDPLCYPTDACFDADPVARHLRIPVALRYRRCRRSCVRDLDRPHS